MQNLLQAISRHTLENYIHGKCTSVGSIYSGTFPYATLGNMYHKLVNCFAHILALVSAHPLPTHCLVCVPIFSHLFTSYF